jgi:hypothetical protein
MKFPTMQSSPFSCYFLLLTPNVLLSTVLKLCSFRYVTEHSPMPILNTLVFGYFDIMNEQQIQCPVLLTCHMRFILRFCYFNRQRSHLSKNVNL